MNETSLGSMGKKKIIITIDGLANYSGKCNEHSKEVLFALGISNLFV